MPFTATDGTVFTDRGAWRKHEFETQYTFKNKTGETLVKSPGKISGQPFDLAGLHECEIQLLDHSEQVQCDEVTKSRVFIAACCEALFVRDCSDCVFVAACKQLRTRDCKNCIFYLYSKTEPIIETSTGIKFGQFNGAYKEHAAHLKEANLTTPNLWFAVFDFNDDHKTGENWSLMEKEEEAPVWRPLDDGAEVAVPRVKKGSIAVPTNSDGEGTQSFGIGAMMQGAGGAAAPAPAQPEETKPKGKSKFGWNPAAAAAAKEKETAPPVKDEVATTTTATTTTTPSKEADTAPQPQLEGSADARELPVPDVAELPPAEAPKKKGRIGWNASQIGKGPGKTTNNAWEPRTMDQVKEAIAAKDKEKQVAMEAEKKAIGQADASEQPPAQPSTEEEVITDAAALQEEEEVQPKRLGLKLAPPTLLLEFLRGGNLFHKLFRFNAIPDTADPAMAATTLSEKYPQYLGPDKVPNAQLERMLRKLLLKTQPAEAGHSFGAELGTERSIYGQVDEFRHSNQDDGIVDSEASDSFVERVACDLAANDKVESLELDDLNKVSPEELAAVKARMDNGFKEAQLRPGDPGYVHDKRIEFEAAGDANEWDDEDDEEEVEAGVNAAAFGKTLSPLAAPLAGRPVTEEEDTEDEYDFDFES
ncbi:unnamed protein product [Chrysoparadoxa australica]